MREAALRYADRGFAVIPLEERGKRPLVKWKGRRLDAEAVGRFWTQRPCANVGLVTGDGLVVLDVDARAGGFASLDRLDLPDTQIVHTGGGGEHHYFTGQAVSRAGVWPGIDVKGAGGYVVAPPSVHASGMPYLHGRVCDVAPLPEGLLPPRTPGPPARAARPAAVEPVLWTIANAREGERNDLAFWGACRVYEQVLLGTLSPQRAEELLHAAINSMTNPLPEGEAARTLQSALETILGDRRGRSN